MATDGQIYYGDKQIILVFELLRESLTPRERFILMMRFGLTEGGKTHNLEEVAKEFGVTRERIRQIEAKALQKIKKGLEWKLNEK